MSTHGSLCRQYYRLREFAPVSISRPRFLILNHTPPLPYHNSAGVCLHRSLQSSHISEGIADQFYRDTNVYIREND